MLQLVCTYQHTEHKRSHLLVKTVEDFVAAQEELHMGAQVLEDSSKLNANVARTDHCQPLGNLLKLKNVIRCDAVLRPCTCTGTVVASDGNHVGRLKPTMLPRLLYMVVSCWQAELARGAGERCTVLWALTMQWLQGHQLRTRDVEHGGRAPHSHTDVLGGDLLPVDLHCVRILHAGPALHARPLLWPASISTGATLQIWQLPAGQSPRTEQYALTLCLCHP